MQRFAGVKQDVRMSAPSIRALLLCFRAALVFGARVPVINVLPLCISGVFTSDEIIHNGPSEGLVHKNICSLFSGVEFRFHACSHAAWFDI